MGVISDGSYDIPPGLLYSYPVTCKDGEWSIVQGEMSCSHCTKGRQRAGTRLPNLCRATPLKPSPLGYSPARD